MTLKRLFLASLLGLSAGCTLLPDPADLEAVLPPPEAYETGIDVPEFVR